MRKLILTFLILINIFTGTSIVSTFAINTDKNQKNDLEEKYIKESTEYFHSIGIYKLSNPAYIYEGDTNEIHWIYDAANDLLILRGSGALTIQHLININQEISLHSHYNLKKIKHVHIGYGITSIDFMSFAGYTKLISVIIPQSVTSIDFGALQKCKSLTSIIIPQGVTSIGLAAFKGCNNLSSVTIPQSVTSISKLAFVGCFNLSSINIPSYNTSVHKEAFEPHTTIIYPQKDNS